jgi:hypothetical protein
MPVSGASISHCGAVHHPAVDVYEGELVCFFGRKSVASLIMNEAPDAHRKRNSLENPHISARDKGRRSIPSAWKMRKASRLSSGATSIISQKCTHESFNSQKRFSCRDSASVVGSCRSRPGRLCLPFDILQMPQVLGTLFQVLKLSGGIFRTGLTAVALRLRQPLVISPHNYIETVLKHSLHSVCSIAPMAERSRFFA